LVIAILVLLVVVFGIALIEIALRLRDSKSDADRMSLEAGEITAARDAALQLAGQERVDAAVRERQIDEAWSQRLRTEVAAARHQSTALSRVAHLARVSEQVAPFLPGFIYDHKDVQWVGGAVDCIVWDGMERGDAVTVVLLDIKTGKTAELTDRQRRIREAVSTGRFRFAVYHWDASKGPT
jgi:predicted Holliday junction resolvase-like endonuclease